MICDKDIGGRGLWIDFLKQVYSMRIFVFYVNFIKKYYEKGFQLFIVYFLFTLWKLVIFFFQLFQGWDLLIKWSR